jgi:hypothetical protein
MKFNYISALQNKSMYVWVIQNDFVHSVTLHQSINTADGEKISQCNMGNIKFHETSNPN